MKKSLLKIKAFKCKICLFILLVLMTFPIIGQTKHNILSKKTISELNCEFYQRVDIEKK